MSSSFLCAVSGVATTLSMPYRYPITQEKKVKIIVGGSRTALDSLPSYYYKYVGLAVPAALEDEVFLLFADARSQFALAEVVR
ncbi:hypothetical protein KSD_89320 [Ktedonobacter sp. SOSP1-85]|nr:hypothetical protein KSD_89320 [Ktedonobacter sp. SOSP1-85]